MLTGLLMLSGCGGGGGSLSSGEPPSDRVVPLGAPVPKGGGQRWIGPPYVVMGRLFIPMHEPYYDRVGTAAWMAYDFHGRRTANGEIHDSNALLAAHPSLMIPSYIKVTNLENGRQLVLRVNDRGPFNDGRLIDVSRVAARLLGFHRAGLARVRVQYLRPAPLDGDTTYEHRFLALQPWLRCGGRPLPEPRDCVALMRPWRPHDISRRWPPRARAAAISPPPSWADPESGYDDF